MEMIKNNKAVVAVVAALLVGVTAFLVNKSSDAKVEDTADTATEAVVVAPVEPATAPAVEAAPVDPAAVPAAEVKPAEGGEVVITAPAAAPVAEKK